MPVRDRLLGPNPSRDDGVQLRNGGILSIFTPAASARPRAAERSDASSSASAAGELPHQAEGAQRPQRLRQFSGYKARAAERSEASSSASAAGEMPHQAEGAQRPQRLRHLTGV
jgi:hypothetical protein